jgi:putative endonuclease
MRDVFIYMLASKPHGTLYIGVTNDLVRRCAEHRAGEIPGFTRRHHVKQLVWFETTPNISAAIQREKTLKHWPRQWKINLIEQANPTWRDLFPEIVG